MGMYISVATVKNNMEISQTKIELSYDPVNPTSGNVSKENTNMMLKKNMHFLLIAALFTVAK